MKTIEINSKYQTLKEWAISALLLALIVLGFIGATGCGGDPDETVIERQGETTLEEFPAPEDVPELRTRYLAPGQTEEQADADMAAFLGSLEGSNTIGDKLNEHDAYAEADERARAEQLANPEKGSFPALMGWAIGGTLVFQDGLQNTDHCKMFGLSCDSAWHIQASDISITSAADWLDTDSFRSRCGSVATNALYPCVIPLLNAGAKSRKWFFDAASCPNDATGRTNVRNAIISDIDYLNLFSGITLSEGADASSSHFIFRCVTTLGDGTAAQWMPNGNLVGRYATARVGGVGSWTESCETAGFPGSNPVARYTQQPDMMYTYNQSIIQINWTPMFQFVGSCRTDNFHISQGVRNILLHEMGHAFTFAHDQYVNIDMGIMRTGISCAEATDRQMGFTNQHLAAINALNTSTVGNLEIPDFDLSCLKPLGQ